MFWLLRIVNKRVAPCVLDGCNFLLHINVMAPGDASPRGRCYGIAITRHAETGSCPYAPGTLFLGQLLSWLNLFSSLCLPNACSFRKIHRELF